MKDVRAEETEDFFPCGKSDPNYRARLRACALLRWTGARGGPIRIWLLGNGPEKDASLFPVLSTHRSPLLLLFGVSGGDTYAFRWTDFKPGACTERREDRSCKCKTTEETKNKTRRRLLCRGKQRSCEVKIKLNKLNIYFYCFCLLYSLIHIIKSFNFLRIK